MSEIVALLDFMRQHPVVEGLLKQGFKMVVGRGFATLKKRLEKSPELTSAQMQERFDRLEDSYEELAHTVADLKATGNWDELSAQRELAEPSAETFIDRAVNMSIDSRSEAKRRFIGRLIAKRLQSNGTDEYDMIVERALAIIGELSERELLALGAISFVRNLGDPDVALADLEAVEEWMIAQHGRTVRSIETGPEWDDDTLERLGQAGAVALHLRGGVAVSEPAEHGDVLDTFVAQRGLSLQVLFRDNAGSPEYEAENRHRFPTLMAIQRISRGRQFPLGTTIASYRLDEQYLTAAGEMLGEEILASLARNLE